MPSGLIALLDDIVGITKIAAASLDDVGAAAGKAGTKAMGVVVDDAAVTPRYVTDFEPDRELPIIARIAAGSLRNKLLILLPVAIALSAFAPWAITPLLMLGGTYLCFEGAEKIIAVWRGDHSEEAVPAFEEPAEAEAAKISGAIRTDFILSAEIMAIALASVTERSIAMQAASLAVVAVAITAAVYGAVALIVKMDDFGLVLARRSNKAARELGRGLVHGMPVVMSALSIIGTAAMLWVGGQIIVHGLEQMHIVQPAHAFEAVAGTLAEASGVLAPAIHWLVGAVLAGVFGVFLGVSVAQIVHGFAKFRKAVATP
jgi:predicted DNA repair protein MutK